jgi:hypothetical protein
MIAITTVMVSVFKGYSRLTHTYETFFTLSSVAMNFASAATPLIGYGSVHSLPLAMIAVSS